MPVIVRKSIFWLYLNIADLPPHPSTSLSIYPIVDRRIPPKSKHIVFRIGVLSRHTLLIIGGPFIKMERYEHVFPLPRFILRRLLISPLRSK